jgi:hypothetical protein
VTLNVSQHSFCLMWLSEVQIRPLKKGSYSPVIQHYGYKGVNELKRQSMSTPVTSSDCDFIRLLQVSSFSIAIKDSDTCTSNTITCSKNEIVAQRIDFFSRQ